MGKDHLRRITCFQSHPRRVVQYGQPVRDERVAQAVLGPRKALALRSGGVLRACVHAHRPRGLPNGRKPQLEIVRDRNQTALPSLGLARSYGDETSIQVNLTPIKPLQFRRPQARESTKGQERPQSVIGLLEQAGDIFRHEDRNRCFLFLVPHHAGEWTGTLEQMALSFRPISASAQHPPHVVLGRGPELEAAEPFIECRRRQVAQAQAGEGFRQLPRELPAQEHVMRREARLFPRTGELLRYFAERQPGNIGAVIPQEEFDRFPQSRLAEFADRLCVFLNGYMQRVTWCKNPPRRHETFQFGRSHCFDRLRVICQFSEDLSRHPLGFRFVGKVLLNPPASEIICQLVHRLSAINRAIKFDRLSAI